MKIANWELHRVVRRKSLQTIPTAPHGRALIIGRLDRASGGFRC